jgi:hypothetical protein
MLQSIEPKKPKIESMYQYLETETEHVTEIPAGWNRSPSRPPLKNIPIALRQHLAHQALANAHSPSAEGP